MPQTSLLESREACEIKLTKPFKFKTGRSDCVPPEADPEGRGYVTTKPEVRKTDPLFSKQVQSLLLTVTVLGHSKSVTVSRGFLFTNE